LAIFEYFQDIINVDLRGQFLEGEKMGELLDRLGIERYLKSPGIINFSSENRGFDAENKP
jgi:hypothetical protein